MCSQVFQQNRIVFRLNNQNESLLMEGTLLETFTVDQPLATSAVGKLYTRLHSVLADFHVDVLELTQTDLHSLLPLADELGLPYDEFPFSMQLPRFKIALIKIVLPAPAIYAMSFLASIVKIALICGIARLLQCIEDSLLALPFQIPILPHSFPLISNCFINSSPFNNALSKLPIKHTLIIVPQYTFPMFFTCPKLSLIR